MKELSIFVDESGDAGETSRYYLITLVLHDQDLSIRPALIPYRQALRDRGLQDIPLHLGPLLNGNDAYRNMSISTRKSHLYNFVVLSEHLPFSYMTLVYRKSEVRGDSSELLARMKRGLTFLLLSLIHI